MKTLTLLRHAKSTWTDPVLRDFDRPLNTKGQRAAQRVGREMKALGLVFDRVVASPAVRVMETLEHVEQGYGRALAPDWDRRIYLASEATLLDVLQEQAEATARLLLVGHNPGLEDLVLGLTPGDAGDPLRGAVTLKFPTASMAVLQFDGAWGSLQPGTARLARFVRPRDLDPALGPEFD